MVKIPSEFDSTRGEELFQKLKKIAKLIVKVRSQILKFH